MSTERTYTAFAGHKSVATGSLESVLSQTMARLDGGETGTVLIFDDRTGAQIDFDLRGSLEEVLARLPQHPMFHSFQMQAKKKPGPGRPKLGVVGREITLLPRHWEWLEQQHSGISAVLRRLVEKEMKDNPGQIQIRTALAATGSFMSAMAGDLPDFEEATRALYAHNKNRLNSLIAPWPEDVRVHIEKMAARALPDGAVNE